MMKEIPIIDRREYDKLDTAVFGMGWFWGPDAQFGLTEGVKYTEVGYAGGHKENPTYKEIGDHTETVRIHYNPDVITFKDMIRMFFNTQTCPDLNTAQQYRSIVFYQNEEEKDIALRVKKEIEEKNNQFYDTDILPYRNFYLAEEYHQKYYFKRAKKLFEEMLEIYPDLEDMAKSTAVGHMNGYIHGNGNSELLSREVDKLGLSKEGQEMLIKYVRHIEKNN